MMLASSDLWIGIAGTVVLWATSGVWAVALGILLAAGSLSTQWAWYWAARVSINMTRGAPTSLLVIAAGLGMMSLARAPELPTVFPGTPAAFQHVAWGIMIALALGSAGHLAEMFRAARLALGRFRLEQATVLGLSSLGCLWQLARGAAAIALPPTGTRLVHHLHNTAFAARLPVADLFGAIQGQANATCRVFHFALLGCLIYVYAAVGVLLPRLSLPLQAGSAGLRGIPLLLLVFLFAHAPWHSPGYRHKVAPSQLAVIWTCRETLQEEGICPIPRFSPDLAKNHRGLKMLYL